MIELIIGAAIVDGLYGAHKCEKIDSEASRKNAKAFTKNTLAEEKIRLQQEALNKSIMKNAKRKQGILVGYMEKFRDVYKIIREICFEPGDGVKEVVSYDKYSLALSETNYKLEFIKDKQLSDKEILCGLALKGLSGMMVKTSEISLSAAKSRVLFANVAEEQAETICIALKAIQDRIDIMSTLLSQLGLLFNKSLKATDEVIKKNGKDKLKYAKKEKEVLANCINMAQVIYVILDTPLLDKDGEVTKASIEAIAVGEQYIKMINQLA